MGGCLSKGKTSLDNYDEEPEDTVQMSEKDLPILNFHALLTKVKIKKCQHHTLSLKFNFADIEEFQIAEKRLENEAAKWSLEHKTQFKLNELQMRKKFVVISFIDHAKTVLHVLKINLYMLAVGPYHQDFAVDSKRMRISFNLKIAQIVSFRFETLEVQMIPREKEYPGDKFAFSLQSIMGDNIDDSKLSYPTIISLSASLSQSSDKDEATMQPDKSLRTSNNEPKMRLSKRKTLMDSEMGLMEVEKKEIKWSLKSSEEMPSLTATLPLYDLHSGSIKVIFYSLQQDRDEIESECFVSLNKLLNQNCTLTRDPTTNFIYEVRDISIDLKNWDHGKEVGLSKLKCKFYMQSHLKQMQVCVRTQNGIQQASPVFSGQDSKGSTSEIEELQKFMNEIQLAFIQLAQIKSQHDIKQNKSATINQINYKLDRSRQLLQQTSKESRVSFDYSNENQLLNGQRILIDLGFKVLKILNQDNQQIAARCWRFLSSLMQRGQLTLAQMGYSKAQKEECLSAKISSFLKKKHETSICYQQLINRLLKISLSALNTYNSEQQKEFAEMFCAYAYFRIPVFRFKILNSITKTEDPQIEEWRGTEFSLHEALPPSGDNVNVFELMFDWENNFYKYIQKEKDYGSNMEELGHILTESDWQKRMAKRGGAYFAFVRYWVAYIENIAVNSKHVNWKSFPGYPKILHTFMVEMKSKPLGKFSEAMRRAAASLLSNQKLLNTFVLILFKKTNLYEQASVLIAIDVLNLFFESITKRSRSIPSTFDFKLYLRTLKCILEGDYSFSIGKVLILLYNHFKLFPIEFRVEMSMYIMTKTFFKFFLHWSSNVRTIFHHLIYVRIYHEGTKPLEQVDSKDQDIYKANPEYRTEIISRFTKLIMILENAQVLEHKINRKINNLTLDKSTYQKMRKKLQQKRRKKEDIAPEVDQFQSSKHGKPTQETLMEQLWQPRLERYNSEIINNGLKVALDHVKSTKKDEIINLRGKERAQPEPNMQSKRKLTIFATPLEDELNPIMNDQIKYVTRSLEEYHKMNESFIKHVKAHAEKDSVPVVKLEMSLDAKEIRPQGIDYEIDEW